jgi:hypothetical protein
LSAIDQAQAGGARYVAVGTSFASMIISPSCKGGLTVIIGEWIKSA